MDNHEQSIESFVKKNEIIIVYDNHYLMMKIIKIIQK